MFKSSSESIEYADITGVEHQGQLIHGAIVLYAHGSKASFAEMFKAEAELVANLIREQKQLVGRGVAGPMPPAAQSDSRPRVEKACPMCGEQILTVARRCKHCGEMLD
jgi:hypothetical protein